jgi:hypothetical protein
MRYSFDFAVSEQLHAAVRHGTSLCLPSCKETPSGVRRNIGYVPKHISAIAIRADVLFRKCTLAGLGRVKRPWSSFGLTLHSPFLSWEALPFIGLCFMSNQYHQLFPPILDAKELFKVKSYCPLRLTLSGSAPDRVPLTVTKLMGENRARERRQSHPASVFFALVNRTPTLNVHSRDLQSLRVPTYSRLLVFKEREGPAANTNLIARCEKPHVNQVTLVPYRTVPYRTVLYCIVPDGIVKFVNEMY